MAHHLKHTTVFATVIGIALTLSACVAPPRRPDVAYTPSAAQALPPAQRVAPAMPVSAPLPTAPSAQAMADYRQFLESQLLCPAKGVLDVQAARKRGLDAKVLTGRPTESPAASGTAYAYPVSSELSVFGFKVVALELEGTLDNKGAFMANDGALYADLDTTQQAVEKVFKSKGIAMRQPKGGPGLVGKRPYNQFTSIQSKGKLVRIGCFLPID